jgi:hypothetical protein
MSEKSWWQRALTAFEKRRLKEDLFSDLPVGIDPSEFVANMDSRLNDVLQEGVKELVGLVPWDTIESQIFACYYSAWGETRSADTFSRQVEMMRNDYPVLKLGVSRQIHDEMRHFVLYRDCAMKLGGKDVLETRAEEIAGSLMRMFDFCDGVSKDPREMVFACQFVDERNAIFLFREYMSRTNLHPEFLSTLEKIIPDEYFHVSNGRTAARMLAKEGASAQERLLEIASETLYYTITDIADPRRLGSVDHPS